MKDMILKGETRMFKKIGKNSLKLIEINNDSLLTVVNFYQFLNFYLFQLEFFYIQNRGYCSIVDNLCQFSTS